MSEWRDVRLGDVLTLQRGFDLPARDRVDGPYPIVSSSGVTGYHAVARADPPGVVIGRYGSLGSVHWVTEPYWPHNTALWVKDFKGNDPRFTSYLLRTISHDGSAAAAVPGVNRNHLHALSVRIPPLMEQRRIARVLAIFDQHIEINERRIELFEDIAHAIYREWFVRFRYAGWRDAAFVDTPAGRVPAGWEVGRLREFVTTQYGFTASASADPIGPRFLRGMDINKRSYTDWSTVPYCAISADRITKFQLSVGDVCVVRMADPGKVGIVERPVEAVFASYLVRIRSSSARLPPQLLAHYLRDSPYQGWVTGSSTGTTRKSASAGVLTEPFIALPPAPLAEQFEAEAGALRAALNALVEQNASLARTRDRLVPRLVTGRLNISDLDLDSFVPGGAVA